MLEPAAVPLVFLISGGFCDSQILCNVAESSGLKADYWRNRWGAMFFRFLVSGISIDVIGTVAWVGEKRQGIQFTTLTARGRSIENSRAVIRCTAGPRWFLARTGAGRVKPDSPNDLPQSRQNEIRMRVTEYEYR